MIYNFFQNICSKLEIQNDSKLKIDNYKKDITACIDIYLKSNLAQNYSQYIGSYGRSTAIYSENIRLMVIIPEDMYWNLSLDIPHILENLKKALISNFLSCEYSDNGNGLNINIDGNLSFEIVPGFMFNNGEYIHLHNNNWQKINLKKERENFNKLNIDVDNTLVTLCRILKIWKNTYMLDISNILLDTLAYHFFYNQRTSKEYTFNNYDELIFDFFLYLSNNCKREKFISFDGITILKKRIDLSDPVFYTLSTAQRALSSAKSGMIEEAIKDWQNLLGLNAYLN